MINRIFIKEAEGKIGEKITLAGWVSRTRNLKNIRFIVLRDRTGEIQIVVKPEQKDMFEKTLGREDVISVTGKIEKSQFANAGVEFIPDDINIINKSMQPLPIDIAEIKKSDLDTRLNYRFLDFRTPITSAIFRIQDQILQSFRGYLRSKDYLEFQPPCIIGSASEGGADLFSIPYFEKMAYLAQSPQLYKQMCAISFEKVFTITPIWRAEKFNSPTHLNEVRQMDIEQTFADDETVMSVLENLLVYILTNIKTKCQKELGILNKKLIIPELKLTRITYTEAIELLQESGEEIIWGNDFTKTQERLLTELIGKEAFFIKDWPAEQKAFYAMPYQHNNPKDSKYLSKTYPKISKSLNIVRAFDCLYGGVEIGSGTQRIHSPEQLRDRIKYKGMDPNNFNYYINSFAYGAPPHAGWSIGLERLTMIITGQNNIREACMFPRDRDRLVP